MHFVLELFLIQARLLEGRIVGAQSGSPHDSSESWGSLSNHEPHVLELSLMQL